MKFSSVLLLAAGASAQISIYTSVATAVDKQVKSLDSLVKAYTGGNGAAIFKQASSVLTAVNNGKSAVAAASPITDLGVALTLLTYYTPLASDISTLAKDLISKKSLASKNGIQASAESILIRERSAAISLANVVTSKLQGGASAGRPIAKTSVVDPITSALNSAVSAYA